MQARDEVMVGSLRERLRQRVSGRADGLTRMTREFVRIDSQTPPSATGPMAASVAEILSTNPRFEVRVLESDPPVVNLIAVLRGGLPGPRLVLSGHLDTYPIGDPAAWKIDPLGGEVEDGRLYGRGSADMKGGLAVQIAVAQDLADEQEAWPGELVLAFAGDEELMGTLGSQRLIDTESAVLGDGILIADVGSPQIVRCGEKGMIWLTLEAKGRAAHGAHVHRGINAVDRLMMALSSLKTLTGLPVEMPADVRRTIETAQPISEPLGGDGEAAIMQSVTVNIGRIDGGISANLIPDAARAEVDIRLPIGTTVAGVEAEIERLIAGMDGICCRITRRYEPSWTSPDAAIVRATVGAAADVIGCPTAANMRVGASDARLFRAAGLPTAVCGLTPFNLGAPDEYLALEELSQLAEIYALAAVDFLATG